MAEIAKEGGALHCISWNVYLPKSHVKDKSPPMRYFCASAIFGCLEGQMGDKTGENLQISKLKIKNLQKWTKF